MKKSIFLTVLLAAFFVSAALADPGDTLWTRTYGGSDDDLGFTVQQTTDGGYILAGYTTSYGAGLSDFYLIKTDDLGGELWTQTFGRSYYDYGYSVQQTSDGGYIISGQTFNIVSPPFGNNVYLVKTDADGDTLWTREFGGNGDEFGYGVQQTTDGGYIVAGYTASYGAGASDVWLIKTDANGDTLWTQTYGGSADDRGHSVQQTTDEGYIIAGYTMSFGADLIDVYLIKTDAQGNSLWQQTYSRSDVDFCNSVQQTSDGGYILAGYTGPYPPGRDDLYLIKTDANGDTLWTQTYGGSAPDRGYSVQQTTDGGYILSGYTASYGAGVCAAYLIKTDALGDTLWTQIYGGSGNDYGYSVQQTTDGGYIITGYTNSFGAGGYDFYLVRVAGEAPLPDVSIEIVPDDPPVTVPQGGSFGFTGSLTNNIEDPRVSDAWTMAVGPQKETYGPFKVLNDVELEPFETRTAHFNQHVPNLAPLGFYDYIAYCGDYPSTVMDSSYFQIEVVAGEFTEAGQAGWVLTGSFLEGDLADLPSAFALLGNYPNPFNAITNISFNLAEAGNVSLNVYDITGRLVVTLVDGQMDAGQHVVAWDASSVSSGVYFYKLTAGDYSATKSMNLLK